MWERFLWRGKFSFAWMSLRQTEERIWVGR